MMGAKALAASSDRRSLVRGVVNVGVGGGIFGRRLITIGIPNLLQAHVRNRLRSRWPVVQILQPQTRNSLVSALAHSGDCGISVDRLVVRHLSV
jgi:hypothetical protein